MRQKTFSKYKEPAIPYPNLTESQTNSYQWLIKEGLAELFKEFSPIEDYAGKEFTLEFLDYSLGEAKFDEYYAKKNNLSYEAPLKIKVRLTNKSINHAKEQEVFLSDFPVMTSHGSFVINGIERVIVPQLARSYGVYFTATAVSGRRYFGAKIIPARGAWIEFETNPDGAIYVRIDRKRKVGATALLRIFGLKSNDEMKSRFSKVDNGEVEFIAKTLEKDLAKGVEEAYVEIYRRIRPGEMATYENAKGYLDDMFSFNHYDFSQAGRYRVNHRLGFSMNDIEGASRVITLEDVVATLSEIIKLNNTSGAEPDDIDHLGSRRVRGVGELLQQRLRVGMVRMKKNIQDRMSTLEPETLSPTQLVNNRPFSAVVKEFFATNQLSQFMSQKNILDELEHLRRLSALGPGGLSRGRAGFEVRDVHVSHYGRICPIETPEGPNIGLVIHFANYARLNKYGILETPYRKVKDKIVTNEIVYLNALDEGKFNIAHAGVNVDSKTKELLDEKVEARVQSKPGLIEREKVHYLDVSTNQAFSVATSMIPFLEHDDATRALMGSNMQKQAVPCLSPEAPIVATGIEAKAARDTGRMTICEGDGEVSGVDGSKVTIKEETGKVRVYNLINFMRSNAFTVIHQRPSVSLGQKVKKGEPLSDNYSSDEGQMALGQNVLVAFMAWRGYNFEDAIIISERLLKKSKFSSVRIEEFTVNVRDTKLGPEINTYDIPNVGEEKLKDLDEEGIVRIGAYVKEGDILVGKISPKGEVELTPEERLLRSIFGEKALDVKDTSLRLDHGKRGRVVGVKVFSEERGDKLEPGILKQIQVEIAQIRDVSVGDKLSGRHGNKGVISKIVPEQDMPYLEDGTPVDIILNPLGVASRMNIGQILETHLGIAAHTLNYQAITPVLSGVTEEEIKAELKEAGLPESGKRKLYDGLTGEPFEQPITVGIMYMMKLDHMVEDKIHMRSIGPYSLITQQPLGGKAQEGGQRFGEMEVWALEGYGAAHILQEMLTIKSDDIVGRVAAYDSIIRGESFKSPHLPAVFQVLLNEMKGIGLDVELKDLVERLPEEKDNFRDSRR